MGDIAESDCCVEISYIPENPPFPPNEQLTDNAYFAYLINEPKHANALISNIDGITGFSDEDAQSVYRFMKVAIELAKASENLIINAAVIVDPSAQQIIASAGDETHSWHGYKNKNSIGDVCNKEQSAANSCIGPNGISNQGNLTSNAWQEKSEKLHISASCLNHWQWSQQQSGTSTSLNSHPLRHAALVAIESSADMDKRLFPAIDNVATQSFQVDNVISACGTGPAKRQKPNHQNVESENGLDTDGDSTSAPTKPYLCTGYGIYLVWEPCPMSLGQCP